MTQIKTVTLTANTLATVTLDVDARVVEVMSVDGADAVYFTVDGADPTVAGDDVHVLPRVVSALEVAGRGDSGGTTTVKLISAGAPIVSVRALSGFGQGY